MRLANQIGVDWSRVDLNQLRIGISVEKEHCKTVGGDMRTVARIARDHILEIPDYYDRLERMERRAGVSEGITSAAVTIIELWNWLREKRLDHDLAIWTMWDWQTRMDTNGIGIDAPITITADKSEINLAQDFTRFCEERGYRWELGHSWSVHLYPIVLGQNLRGG